MKLLSLACVLLLGGSVAGPLNEKPPLVPLRPADQLNFVFILADDLGWADLGCYGNRFNETPALDSLARTGLRFTQGYATCPVCSPSRSSIMTGKTPIATGVTDWLPGRKTAPGSQPADRLIAADTQQFLDEAEITLPEVLRQTGYATGLFGKWHLGEHTDSLRYAPERSGFDVAVGKPHGGSPVGYFFPYRNNLRQSTDLNPTGKPGEYLTDRLTDEAIRFMDAHRERPFFAYVSHHAVHTPIQAKPALIEKYKTKLAGRPNAAPTNAEYAALLESLDQSVGHIRAYLRRTGLDKTTVLIFTSDNGGLAVPEGKFTPATSNAPLREGKGHVYEGGIRVPLLVVAPGLKPGLSEAVVWGADFFSTLLELAGVENPNPGQMEGRSFAPLLRAGGQKYSGRRTLYWHYPHYSNQRSQPAAAIREGDWKLVQHFEDNRVTAGNRAFGRAAFGRLELYDLARDVSEKTNLARAHSQKVKALLAKLDAWREKHHARLPTPKP